MNKLFKGTWEQIGFWGAIWNSLREQSENIFGNKRDFGNFFREHGNTAPWGASQLGEAKMRCLTQA